MIEKNKIVLRNKRFLHNYFVPGPIFYVLRYPL